MSKNLCKKYGSRPSNVFTTDLTGSFGVVRFIHTYRNYIHRSETPNVVNITYSLLVHLLVCGIVWDLKREKRRLYKDSCARRGMFEGGVGALDS